MKKVFAYIASHRKESSSTYRFAEMVINALKAKDSTIQSDIYHSGGLKIAFCIGCWTCAIKGACPHDRIDDMGLLKEKMAAADLIIWGSPNYVMNVSAQMKVFLDRLLPWWHRFPLVGKVGIPIMTSGGTRTAITAPDDTQKYLAGLMMTLGIKVVDILFASTVGIGSGVRIIDEEKAGEDAKKAVEAAWPYLSGEKEVDSDPSLEQVFTTFKHSVSTSANLVHDMEYWEKEGMLKFDSFNQMLERARQIRIKG